MATVATAPVARGGGATAYVDQDQPPFLATAGVRRLTRLMVPENVNSGRSPDFRMPRRKIIEPPARVTSPVPSISSPSRAASRNSQPNDTVTAGPSRIGEAIANRQ